VEEDGEATVEGVIGAGAEEGTGVVLQKQRLYVIASEVGL
jgi:hypothetical protein